MDNQKDLPLEVIRAIKVLWSYGHRTVDDLMPITIDGLGGVYFKGEYIFKGKYISPIALDMMMLRREAESE